MSIFNTSFFRPLIKVLRPQELLIYILVISTNKALKILLNIGKKFKQQWRIYY